MFGDKAGSLKFTFVNFNYLTNPLPIIRNYLLGEIIIYFLLRKNLFFLQLQLSSAKKY